MRKFLKWVCYKEVYTTKIVVKNQVRRPAQLIATGVDFDGVTYQEWSDPITFPVVTYKRSQYPTNIPRVKLLWNFLKGLVKHESV